MFKKVTFYNCPICQTPISLAMREDHNVAVRLFSLVCRNCSAESSSSAIVSVKFLQGYGPGMRERLENAIVEVLLDRVVPADAVVAAQVAYKLMTGDDLAIINSRELMEKIRKSEHY
jgi:hypothetical protein